MDGYLAFTTKEMIDTAHKLGLKVKPWTVSCHIPVLRRASDTRFGA